MLPAVLEWNATVLGAKSYAIADAMGQGSQDAHVVVKTLISELGLPTSLRQLDVPRYLLQQIAERAYAHPVVRKNPRPIVKNVSAILEIAIGDHSLQIRCAYSRRQLLALMISCAPTGSKAQFIRFAEAPQDWHGSLQTSVSRYRSASGVELDLVAAVHVADKRYYDKLNVYFADRDLVLYELVTDGSSPDSARGMSESGLSVVGWLQVAVHRTSLSTR